MTIITFKSIQNICIKIYTHIKNGLKTIYLFPYPIMFINLYLIIVDDIIVYGLLTSNISVRKNVKYRILR